MSENLCFIPSCASEYTRGHPLLFHFLGGIWIKIFGSDFFSVRIFALSISLSLQLSFFYVASKLLNPKLAFFSSVILMLQNIIFAQSTFVFPEILLATFGVWTLYFYLIEKKIFYFISGLLLCLVKEQGIILIASLTIWEIIKSIKTFGLKNIFTKIHLMRAIYVLSPLIGIFIFLFLQKTQKGYWFYPEHLNLVKHKINDLIYQFRVASELIWIKSGRYVMTLILLTSFLLYGKIKPLATRIVLLGLLFILFKIASGKWELPFYFSLSVSLLLLITIIYRFVFSENEIKFKTEIIGASVFFIIMYIIFCSFNFFTDRYLAFVFPIFILISFGMIDEWINSQKLKTFIFLSISLSGIYFLYNEKGFGDTSPRNYQAILLQKKVIDYAIRSGMNKKNLMASYVMTNNLSNPDAGYVQENQKFSNVINIHLEGMSLPEYVIEIPFEKDKNINDFIKKHTLSKIEKITVGDAHANILKVSK
ncbi:MAG: ArnT family glycosyltransferase [Bacteroidota bacterium]